MRLFRIGSTSRSWRADDLTGAGAGTAPGRWNKKGENVVYAATSLAMAVLETAAHIDDGGLPLNKYVIEIDVSDIVWSNRRIDSAHALPGGWDAIPSGIASIDHGSHWLTQRAEAILELPSVIVPEESIVLINPAHRDSGKINAKTIRRLQYNLLFRSK